jgi:hypothetical protein
MKRGKEVSQKKQKHRREGNIFDDALQKCIVGPSTVMIHHSIFDIVGLFREDMEIAEDYELWLRIAYKYEIGYSKVWFYTYIFYQFSECAYSQ